MRGLFTSKAASERRAKEIFNPVCDLRKERGIVVEVDLAR
jgi:hypothetical protein